MSDCDCHREVMGGETSVGIHDNAPTRGTVEWVMSDRPQAGPQSLRQAVIHFGWCCKRPGKFAGLLLSASGQALQGNPNTASRVRLMIESLRDYSSYVFLELDTEVGVEVDAIESRDPIVMEFDSDDPPNTFPLNRMTSILTCVEPTQDLSFLEAEWPTRSYDYVADLLSPSANRATIRAGYRHEDSDTVLYERVLSDNARDVSIGLAIGACTADFYDKPDQDFVRCGFEVLEYSSDFVYAGRNFSWPLEVPKAVFADPDNADVLDAKRYVAVECEGDGTEVYQGDEDLSHPAYAYSVHHPTAYSVCRDANSSAITSEDEDVTPFKMNQPYNVTGLVTLSFSSCFGGGAAASVDEPVGIPEVDNGPISKITMIEGGTGYALLGRVEPSVDILESASGSGAEISATLTQTTGKCDNPVWAVGSVTVSKGGYNYSDGAATLETSDGIVEQTAEVALSTVSLAPTLSIDNSLHTGTTFTVSIQARSTTPETWEVASVAFSGTDTGFSDNEQLDVLVGDHDTTYAAAEVRVRTIFDSNNDDTGQIDNIEVVDGGSYALAGVIDSIAVTAPGKYYKEDPDEPALVADVTITINQNPPSFGTGAKLSAVVDDDPSSPTFSQITSVEIDDGGDGYLSGEVYPEIITTDSSHYLKRFDKVRNARHNVAYGDSWHASHLVTFGSTLAEREVAHKLIVEFVPDPTGPEKPDVAYLHPEFFYAGETADWNSLAGEHELMPTIGDKDLIANHYHKSYTAAFDTWSYVADPPANAELAEGGVVDASNGHTFVGTEQDWEDLKVWPATNWFSFDYAAYPKITAWSLIAPPPNKAMQYDIDVADSGMLTTDYDAAFNTVANPGKFLSVDTLEVQVNFHVELLRKFTITKIEGYRADRTKGDQFPANSDTFLWPMDGVLKVYENEGGSVQIDKPSFDVSITLRRSDIDRLSAGETVEKPIYDGNLVDLVNVNRKLRIRIETC